MPKRANSAAVVKPQARQPTVPHSIRDLLGPPPVLSCENPDAYERLLAQLAAAVAPRDFVEWLWVWDLANLAWEAARLRRAKAVRLEMARDAALRKIFELASLSASAYLADSNAIKNAARRALHGCPEEIAQLQAVLPRLGLGAGAVADAAYAACLSDMERLQAQLDANCARRAATLREIDRRRDAAVERLGRTTAAADEVLDAEFANVPG